MKLELFGITKTFGSLVADDHVDLSVEPGEIHALLGENGAGKTTLMNVLFGFMHPDSGEIALDGEVLQFPDPGAAVRHGIGMVHQHFMLVPVFTVAENVVLGFEPTHRFGLLDRRKARAEIRRISEEFGLEVDPDAVVEELPVGVQQRVEILKALSRATPSSSSSTSRPRCSRRRRPRRSSRSCDRWPRPVARSCSSRTN